MMPIDLLAYLHLSDRYSLCLLASPLLQDFTKHNTPRQNEHCLTNFELSGYQQVFGDLVIQIYQQLIKCTQDQLLPLIGEGALFLWIIRLNVY